MQKFKVLAILIITFLFFNTFVISDSGYVDENNNIYSHADGYVGIGTGTPASGYELTILSDTSSGALTARSQDSSNIIATFRYAGGSNGPRVTIKGYDGATVDQAIHFITTQLSGNTNIYFGDTSDTDILFIDTENGRVGVQTTSPDEALTVNGNIHAEKLTVSAVSADFIFEEDYDLRSIKEVESFIKDNGHLPDIPAAKEVETNGMDVGDMNTRLLQKIEELTLYIIQQEKRITELEEKLKSSK